MRKWKYLVAAALLFVPAAALYLDAASIPADASDVHIVEPPAVQTPTVQSPPVQAPAPQKPVVQAPPAKAPAPRSSWEKAPALQSAVDKAMAGFPGRYSVVVQDLKSGQRWAVGADERYHPASTIKMPVTLYALEQYRAGKLGWQDMITYTQADFESPGGGAFETSPFGGQYPVENLVNRALMYSNNVAVNMLGRHLGWENIRAWTRTIGGDLYRLEDASPEVTPMSELGWWLHLEKVSRQDPKSAELILNPLRNVAYDGRIAAGLPAGVKYLHKFGSYNGYYHDGGWIQGDKPYFLIVMTHGAREDEADTYIAEVSGAVYSVMSK